MHFEKTGGKGPSSGWLKYYADGQRLAKRTAANELRITLVDCETNPAEVLRMLPGAAVRVHLCV